MQNCENDKYDHQMRNKYFQYQRNEQSEIARELQQCFWGGLSEVWVKTKITLWFTHIQEGWQEFSRKLVTSKIYFEAVTFPAAALRGSPHSSHNQVLLWDEQACLGWRNKVCMVTMHDAWWSLCCVIRMIWMIKKNTAVQMYAQQLWLIKVECANLNIGQHVIWL